MIRPVLAVFFSLFVSLAAHAQVDWISFDPPVIRSTRTDAVRLDVQLEPNSGITSVRLDYAAGGSLALTSTGSGRFTASVPASRALAGFDSEDMNRNFVGFLRFLNGSAQVVSSYNLIINVFDATTPLVPVRTLPNNARATSRILNLHRPLITDDTIAAAVQQFYSYFPDDFDFVQVVFTLPIYPGNRYHSVVKNTIDGVGLGPINGTAQFGSAGNLLGITVYPIDTYFDCAESTFSHETGHQWIEFLDNDRMLPGPHWPPSSMATGIMGFNIPGSNVGGDFPYVIEPVGANQVRITQRTTPAEFTDFDLYLMGLLPPTSVRDGWILDQSVCTNCTVAATKFTINDVINRNGPRLPQTQTSKKNFRVATVVISRDRLLTDEELALFEYFAKRGEAKSIVPYAQGLARGVTKPWYVATRGLSTVDLRLQKKVAKKRSVR